jgi:hypothetical protein
MVVLGELLPAFSVVDVPPFTFNVVVDDDDVKTF